ncbi:MAG: CDP-glucose 4,6-dehydratase [Candidatus Aminicenantes bacterium]|nr:CDP-glucose 4,6-dehydratase [Candidatus Aminicenantes bacterium]
MKNILKDTFYKKKVLITGHTGFKGSWLSIWLKELGAEIIGYALDPYTKNDNFVRSSLTDKMIDIRGDVRDLEKLRNAFIKYKPEIVFHMAAQPLVRESYINPKDTFDINIGGTVNIFECCRETESVNVVINVTSDKCYENLETKRGYREDDRIGGYDPYSASKGCSELVTSSYQRSFFNPDNLSGHGKALSSVRAGNVIGGGDWATDRIIPDCIRSLEKEEKIFIRNPQATRPWQLVLEPLGGYLLLAAKMGEDPMKYSGAWNFGPELTSVIPVQVVVEEVIKHWGSGEWYTSKKINEPHEATLLALDIGKAKKELNWSPKYNANEAVQETVSWYKSNLKNTDMFQECVSQINCYMDK